MKNKMKMARKDEVKKKKIKKPIKKINNEKVLVVVQEIKFARLLSGNEKKTRDRVLKTLKKWLVNCFKKEYEFKEDDFIRVWKGLFYAVWMSDKPLVQEELCENIASVLDLFPPKQLTYALLMMKAGFKTLATEWFGIDQHRIDKFMMLVRRYLRGCFRCLRRCGWSVHSCQLFTDMMTRHDGILAVNTPFFARNATSMILHLMDCYLEELSKVSRGSLPDESVAELFAPLCALACCSPSAALADSARAALTQLLRQSVPGLAYADKYDAWRTMGGPPGGPDALVSDDDSGEEGGGDDDDRHNEEMGDDASDSGPLDPRAGRVDVSLAPVPVPAGMLAARLAELLAQHDLPAPGRRQASHWMKRFEQLARGTYPLREPKSAFPAVEQDEGNPRPTVAARALRGLEKKLVADSDELALRGLSRKHRKRLLAKSRAGLAIADELRPRSAASGEWQVETTESNTQTEKKQDRKRKRNRKKEKNVKKRKTEEKVEKKSEEPAVNIEKQKDKTLQEKSKKQINVKEKKQLIKVKQEIQKKKETKKREKQKKKNEKNKIDDKKLIKKAALVVKKVKKFQKQISPKPQPKKEKDQPTIDNSFNTPKKVKFALKNNSMQKPVDYYKSVKQSPNIPFDSSKKPTKTNLKPSTPSPINPFIKKKKLK